MDIRRALLALVTCAPPGMAAPTLDLTERASIDLASATCTQRALLEVTNRGDAPVWGLALEALASDGLIETTHHLAAPLAPNESITLLVCRRSARNEPSCFEARPVQLGDAPDQGRQTRPTRWCSTAGTHPNSPSNEHDRNRGDHR